MKALSTSADGETDDNGRGSHGAKSDAPQGYEHSSECAGAGREPWDGSEYLREPGLEPACRARVSGPSKLDPFKGSSVTIYVPAA